MSNYEFFLTSTHEGGEQRDVCYDGLCECLFDQDATGRMIFPPEHDMQALLLLDEVWRNALLKRWLSRKYGRVCKDGVNETNFLKLVGWMYRRCMIRQEISKREQAMFLFDNAPLSDITTLRWVENALSMEINQKKQGILGKMAANFGF